MNTKVVNFKPSHAKWILDHYPRDEEKYWSSIPGWDENVSIWHKKGPCYSFIVDGKIIMCAGVVEVRKGFGEAWMVISTLFYQYKKECFRVVQKFLNEIIERFGMERVQSFCLKEHESYQAWLEHLGFINESPNGLKRFSPTGLDMYIYARIK